MAGPTTTGLAALIAGEDWHYVGETGEPAFENGWETPSGYIKLAFRIRESGVVDIQGDARNGTPGLPIFTLPVGYRPNNNSQMAAVGAVSTATVPAVAVIGSNGEVAGLASPSLPDSVFFLGQFFLDSPEVAP